MWDFDFKKKEKIQKELQETVVRVVEEVSRMSLHRNQVGLEDDELQELLTGSTCHVLAGDVLRKFEIVSSTGRKEWMAPVSFIPKEGSKETLKDEHGRPMYRLGSDHEDQQSEEQHTRKDRKPQTCDVNVGCTYEELDCDLQYEGERLYCFDRFIVGKLYINNLPDTLIRLEINDNAITSIDPRTFVNGECS